MPSGKIHTSITSFLAFSSLIEAAFLVSASAVSVDAFALPLGCMAGILLSPDLDIDQGNISEAILRKRVGCVISGLWRIYWWPYAKLVRHRSWISHMPFISTGIRLLYAFWWLLLAMPAALGSSITWWFILGLAWVDFAHAWADWFSK